MKSSRSGAVFEDLQQRIGRLLVCPVDVVDEEDAYLPSKGPDCARSFNNRICWIEICRNGPSGGNVTKSTCEANSRGSSDASRPATSPVPPEDRDIVGKA